MVGQSAYQDSATLSVDRSLDDEAVAQDNEEEDTEDSDCDISVVTKVGISRSLWILYSLAYMYSFEK